MPKGFPIDLNAFHIDLWTRSDRMGRVKLVQKEWAETLGITKFTMSRVMTRMVDDGRIRKVSKKKYLDGMFVVTDPYEFTR